MLLEFRFENHKSFRDEQVLSMVAARDSEHQQTLFNTGEVNLVRCAGIWGANASGKSNVIDALALMRGGVLRSADTAPGTPIRARPFAFDKRYSRKPTALQVTFIFEGEKYQFGFAFSRTQVQREWLYAYPKNRARKLFERNATPGTGTKPWYFGPHFKGERDRLKKLTRPNVLFLSVGAKFNHPQLTPVFQWFQKGLAVLDMSDPLRWQTPWETAERVQADPSFKKRVLGLLHSADLAIDGIAVEKEPLGEPPGELFEMFSEKGRQRVLDELAQMRAFKVHTLHRATDSERMIALELEQESMGTQRVFSLARPWLEALDKGTVLVVDEIHASLHPLLTRRLVGLFQDRQTNRHRAQLIFASHDVTLLDLSLLRRDQVWFTEKDGGGASHLYSLAEYRKGKPRKGEPLLKHYLVGRYGAVPVLGEFDLK